MKRRLPKPRKGTWFVAVRGSYLPASWQGWLTYVPYIAYLVFTLIYGVRTTHGLGQTAMFVFPQWCAGAVIMSWLARQKS